MATERPRKRIMAPICRNHMRGRCIIKPCKYAHVPKESVPPDQDEVEVCIDSLRNRCPRGPFNCRWYHPEQPLRTRLQSEAGFPLLDELPPPGPVFLPPGPHVLVPPMLAAGKVRPMLEVCHNWAKGRCPYSERECKRAHAEPTSPDGNFVMVCADFLGSGCSRESCRFFHALNHQKPFIREIPIMPGPPPLEPPPPVDPYAVYAKAVAMYGIYGAHIQDGGKRPRREEPSAYPLDLYAEREPRRREPSQLGPPSYPPPYADRHSREQTPPRGRLDDYPPERSRIDSFPERSRPPLGDSYFDRNRGDTYPDRSRDSYPPERRDPYEKSRGGLGEGYPDRRRERGRSPDWDRRDERHSRDERERSYERRDARGRAKPRLADDKLPVCRDFFYDKCDRRACRFVHPNSRIRVNKDDLTVDICHDFKQGRCRDPDCPNYHPVTVMM